MYVMTEHLSRIEHALNAVLPLKADADWLSAVAGQGCFEVSPEEADRFLEPGRALLRRGGKRWRPLVSVLVCESLGGGTKADILAALTEIPHNGSLIVDDIEDSSPMRRGGKAIHLLFGTDLAVNMGNLMYFLPTMVFGKAGFSEAVTLTMMNDWLTVMRRLHLGQGYDILWHGQSGLFPGKEAYLRMCRFKTGSLASLAARLGVRAAFAPLSEENQGTQEYLKYLESAGLQSAEEETFVQCIGDAWEDMGTGFQILDDVQNLSSGIPGKNHGDDIVEGKKSYPVILHVERHKSDAERLERLFAQAAEGDRAAVDSAIALMEKSGSIDEAREKGRALLEKGKQQILSLLPEHSSRDILVSIVDQFRRKMI